MVAIVDYGMGNLRSVQKAFEFLGARAELVTDPDRVLSADALVLPGVGAIGDAVRNLKGNGMDQALRAYLPKGRPFLGICLGMQMLFEESEEDFGDAGGRVTGLGILPGRVRLLPGGPGLKVPHMGWNTLHDTRGVLFPASSAAEGQPGPCVYFVHSYYVDAADRAIVTARATHGIGFDAAIGRDNLQAVQFHPEKSGAEGLAILHRWLADGGLA
jgi:imidazole glycerol-phosphate synthase subunit HisH